MGLLPRIKAAALFGCLLFVSNSYAVDYYWTSNVRPGQFATATQACRTEIPGGYFGYPLNFNRVDYNGSQLSGTCIYQWAQNDYNGESVSRNGDTCPAGTGPFDPVTRECLKAAEPELAPGEKCENQTGATAENPFIWDPSSSKCEKFYDAGLEASCKYMGNTFTSPTAYTVAGNISSSGQAVAPPTFASSGINCQVKTVSSSECTINVAGAVSCNVMGSFTGEINSQGTKDAADALCPNGQCPPKEPKTETREEGCTPAGNGSGGTTCTQKKETAQEGTQQCGTVNGSYKCVTKAPYSNGITTAITSTSETLSDGSIKVTTVKDSSNTVCTDVNTCTVKTSTTTTHSTTKPSGSTSTGSSCVGSCTPNGGGLETTPTAGTGNNGNGSGSGSSGNGDGDGEGEGGDGTADTSADCEVPPPCDGDLFQCAILKQAHIDTCKLMAGPTAQEQTESDAKTDAAYADLEAHQAELDNKVNGLLSEFQSSTSGGGAGGKCLPDYQFAVAGHSIDMEFSKACDSLSWVRLVVLAGAYLFAARIVSREV